MANGVTVELGNTYIGSAYSPQVEVEETEHGFVITMTYADSDTPGQLKVVSFEVDNAGFGEITASVDNSYGTPYVVVTEGGDNVRKDFDLAFHNLKGFSPTIHVAEIGHGHRVTVTDVNGTQYFDVMDGDPSQAIADAEAAASTARAAAASATAAADEATSAASAATGAAADASEAASAATEDTEAAIGQLTDAANEAIGQLEDATDTIPARVVAEVDAQLEAHPEWTTTVEDGAITYPKLNGSLKTMLRGNILRGEAPEASVTTLDDAAATPLLGATVYGASTQDGTPAPDAPVPIANVTELSLMLTGRNLLDTERWVYVEEDTKTVNGVTITREEDGWFRVSGVRDTAGQFSITMWGSGLYEPKMQWMGLHPGDDIYVTVETEGTPFVNGGNSAANGTCITLYGSTSSVSKRYCGGFADEGAWTIPANTDYLSRVVYYNGANVPVGTEVNGRFRICIVRGTEAPAAYIPYEGGELPIDLQGHELRSLPDGTRDELAVDALGHVTLTQRVGVVTLDGTENWSASSTADVAYRAISDARKESYVDNALCDHFAASIETLANMADPSFKLGQSAVIANPAELLYFRSSTIMTSVADLEAWLANNPTTVTYPLAEPVTIDLGTVTLPTPPSPDLIAWPMTDVPTTMALDYERDIQTALAETRDEVMAAIADPDGPTATANHAQGTYLTMDGRLYRATTAIATGEAIVPGTNVTATTVMAEVLALTQ